MHRIIEPKHIIYFTNKSVIPFFRKIRKKMADDNLPAGKAGKPMKHMRYAIREIVGRDWEIKKYEKDLIHY